MASNVIKFYSKSAMQNYFQMKSLLKVRVHYQISNSAWFSIERISESELSNHRSILTPRGTVSYALPVSEIIEKDFILSSVQVAQVKGFPFSCAHFPSSREVPQVI